MIINSRLFGEIEIAEDKIITFTAGIMGFEEYKTYTILFDSEREKNTVMWLQSTEDAELAFPVMDPMKVCEAYNPVVEDEWLAPLGEVKDDSEYYLLSVLTVPSDLAKMTINLKAPIIVNMNTMKACQLIVNNEEYSVRYNVYDYIQKMKEGN